MGIIRPNAQIYCERCGYTAELPCRPTVGRNVKPTGWGRISIAVKVDPSKPVKVVKTADLCPDCVAAVTEVIEQAPAAVTAEAQPTTTRKETQ